MDDLTSLMMGTLGLPGKDEFGAERDTKRPLLLDSVMEGQPRISGSRLLTIPAEILANIVDFIADDQPTLAALALVNSDCRQVARSCQFVDICFDYSPQSFGLLRALLEEAATRVSAVSQPTIGACIRRITVKSHRHWVASVHRELYESFFGDTRDSYTRERVNELREEATEKYLTYRSTLLMAISAAMPHLETIAWHDQISVDAHFLKVIAHSSIKHLKLSRVPIEEPYLMEPPLTPAAMQLHSLYIDTHLTWRDEDDVENEHTALSIPREISPFFKSLLLRCAPTLESLFLDTMEVTSRRETISLGDEPISFPRLRQLKLGWLKLAPPALSSFLSAPLRQLTLPSLYDCDTDKNVLVNCEPLHDLQILVIPPLINLKTADALVSFLEKHINLPKLCIEQSLPTVLDSQIIPLLSAGNFSNLLSLSLSWSGPGFEQNTRPHIATVAEESIAAIGTIVSLEQLCLTAGEDIGWRCQWLVDHEMLRANLKGLTKLKKLAICRDTYRTHLTTDVEGYYSDLVLPDAEWFDPHARPELDEVADVENDDIPHQEWERAHRNGMLWQAEKYAATIPSLEWVFCGQWPMAIKERGNGTFRTAIPLTKERDDCYTALSRMFAMGGEED
ncbi:uncharacterized protein N7482_002394 [Penicillium canariense]|uniref:F-box domain-containing protein n=1 Tax=Penicillium canariense TaxID=189055 RepID=A0A9W9IHJ9_9EURO|nr:uncharacterized protein N7482_002394 [Penicillium canariense]KAJ5176517.1 hypothetical protein N7482_002394 [Penicillium canariense]